MATHRCPRCGSETEGSQSSGGMTFAICESCMDDNQDEYRERREETERMMRNGDDED